MEPAVLVVAIAGMLTGISVVGAIVWGVVRHAKIQNEGTPADPALAGEVAALRDQVESLQHQVADAHNRLDFAERMLAQGREPNQLRGGSV